jgi:Ca-activated chloride channel family protein
VLEFAHPLAFALLPLPLFVFWLMPPHRERVTAMRVPFFEPIVSAAGASAEEGAVVLRRRLIQRGAGTIVWLLLIIGLAGPERVGDPITRTTAGRDIMLGVDLSGSMDYRDFPSGDGTLVSRFEAVQRVVDEFVAERDGDRVGLIVFGNRAYLQLPFTRDLRTARDLVALMEVGMAGPRTALGDAIGLAIKSFESSEVDQRVLILLTDGSDTASTMTPINAAGIAKLNGVEIHAIGIGDVEARGEDKVDFATLEAIAGQTGGLFYNAEDENALAEVYRAIDRATAVDIETESWRPRDSLVYWPAGLAVTTVLIGYILLLLTGHRRSLAT